VSGTGLSGTGPARRIEVDPERIVRWVNGFAERHGDLQGLASVLAWSSARSSVTLSAADGATAVLQPFAPASSPLASGEVSTSVELEALALWATPPARVALILVRRGGYAVGIGVGPDLFAHKVGTRYVQSRTAAGGWSQHRFARRRDNQADALVGSVIEHARRVVLDSPSMLDSPTEALVVGGDKALVRDVLDDPRLAGLAKLPRRELFDLPDPRLVVLKQALRRGRAVRITLTEPGAALAET
jgi:Actinobacteria/chloroflexi VLRF1 release factor